MSISIASLVSSLVVVFVWFWFWVLFLRQLFVRRVNSLSAAMHPNDKRCRGHVGHSHNTQQHHQARHQVRLLHCFVIG
jgi:ABC-type nickel/cobalt efflux system permease component RcnA